MEVVMIVGEIRQEARGILTGLWVTLVPIWFIYFLILMGANAIFRGDSSFIGSVVMLVLGGPLLMGMTRIFLRIYNKEAFELGQMFDGFKEFARTLAAYLLMMLYIFLWMLLLIVPGIIASLGYSMTFFILAENPDMAASEAMRQSKQMMMGYKWDLFRLGLSFIGWGLLACLTFGIGFLWLESYIFASYMLFYKRIKGEAEVIVPQAEATITPPPGEVI